MPLLTPARQYNGSTFHPLERPAVHHARDASHPRLRSTSFGRRAPVTSCRRRITTSARKFITSWRGLHRRAERRHPTRARTGASGCGHGLDGAAARRDGDRQGAHRDADSRAERAARPRHGARQLRGDSEHAHRERAVRPGEGRVHRRAGAANRPVRAGRSLDDLPRRDRRSAAGRAGQAAARARGAADRAARQPEVRQRRTSGSSPRPTATSNNGLPTTRSGRTFTTVSTCFRSRCRPLRERAEDIPAAGVALRRRVLEVVRQAHRRDLAGEHGSAAALSVAGEHPRAAQCRRARDDRGHRTPPDRRDTRPVAHRRSTRASS